MESIRQTIDNIHIPSFNGWRNLYTCAHIKWDDPLDSSCYAPFLWTISLSCECLYHRGAEIPRFLSDYPGFIVCL